MSVIGNKLTKSLKEVLQAIMDAAHKLEALF